MNSNTCICTIARRGWLKHQWSNNDSTITPNLHKSSYPKTQSEVHGRLVTQETPLIGPALRELMRIGTDPSTGSFVVRSREPGITHKILQEFPPGPKFPLSNIATVICSG